MACEPGKKLVGRSRGSRLEAKQKGRANERAREKKERKRHFTLWRTKLGPAHFGGRRRSH